MGVTTTLINKPFNPRAQDQSPKGYNRASLFSGKALDFDGANDYVDLDGFTLSGTTATISFYYNTDSSKAFAYIFDNSQRWVIGQADTTDSFGFYDGSTWRKSTQTLTLGEWYHITAVIDGGNVEFLWNGESVGDTFTGANSISWASLTTFKLGWSYNASGIGQVNGQIAGFKIFNTALTAEQVADLYNNPEKVVPTGVADSALKLWLPMMEGAGTTAYDGSGNGNHGTISGATYVNGIGAPVAQSAVISWNKGTNIFDNSENFDAWLKNAGNTITSNSIAAPDGLTTADTISSPVSSQINQHQVVSPVTSGADYVFSVWLKKKTTSEIQIYQYSTATPIGFVSRATINFDSGTITDVEGSGATIEEYTNGWFRCAIYCTAPSTSLSHGIYTATAGVADVYAWGGQSEQSDTLGPYVRTGATAQTSEVLLPQGLTTGRDITGVNLFENVRKQGALNLDGKSWAEVHDNESLDITDAITLEAWYYNDGVNATKIIQGRWSNQVDMSYLMYLNNSNLIFVGHSGSGTFGGNASTTSLASNQYSHVAITYDKSYLKYYINGSLVDTFTFTVSLNPNATVVLDIGRNDGRSGVYTGSNYNDTPIAQPRIYNRALTASEIQQNYNAGKNTYTN